MKKTAAILMGLCLCFGMPTAAGAAQVSVIPLSQSSTIGTTVPDSHMIYIQTEHARVLFQDEEGEDEDEEQATMYAVERFSSPEFLIHAEKGWKIQKVLLNDVDVTEQLRDGILTLPEVYEDQRIVVETEESSEDNKNPGKEDKNPEIKDPEEDNRNPMDKNQEEQQKDPVKKNENAMKPAEVSKKTVTAQSRTQNKTTGNTSETTAAATADQQMHITYSITVGITALLMTVLLRNKIKAKKSTEKS